MQRGCPPRFHGNDEPGGFPVPCFPALECMHAYGGGACVAVVAAGRCPDVNSPLMRDRARAEGREGRNGIGEGWMAAGAAGP